MQRLHPVDHKSYPARGSSFGQFAEWLIRRTLLMSCLTCLLALPVGCQQATSEDAEPTEPSESAAPVPVQVTTVARRTLIPQLDLVGQAVALPEKTVEISAQTTGWIAELTVVEGAYVKAGDVLVRLDSRWAEIAVLKAQAALDQAQAHLARLKRGYLPQEIAQAREELRRAEEQFHLAEEKWKALLPIAQRQEISEIQLREARSAVDQAQAAMAAAQAKCQLYEAGTPPEEIAEAEAAVKAAEAELAQAVLEQELCILKTPIDGIVATLPARRGMAVSKATSLARVIDLSQILVEFRIPARHAGDVTLGSEVTVTRLADPATSLKGRLTRLAGEADPATGDLVAYAELANSLPGSDQRQTPELFLLRPGMTCRVHFPLMPRQNVLCVPAAAVADHSGTPVVTIVREGKAYEIPVSLGIKTPEWIEVVSGLNEGDVVVTEGGYGLPEGCPVTLTKAAGSDQTKKSRNTP
jgi:HlyD family secretion protein